jgi:hypothetical protein
MLDLFEDGSETTITPIHALEMLIRQAVMWAVKDPVESAGYLKQIRETSGAIRSEADVTLNVGDKGRLDLKLVRDGTG